MTLWDTLKGELIDIVQWLDDSNDTLLYRFPRYNNEIKHGARLVVREGQAAVFIDEGRIADVFGPGTYTLETGNLPILTTLKGWKYGFASPFKAEVYFCSTRQFTNLKWGTPGPSTIRDPEFGPVRVTAFGLFSIKIKNPSVFIKELAGTDGNFTTDEMYENLRGKIGTWIKEIIPELKIPVIDLESRVVTLGEMLKGQLAPAFEAFGIGLTEIQVQDIGLPEEVERAIDKAGAMKVIGDMRTFTQYETASAIKDAASNPGGLAATGAGAGIGLGIGGQMTNVMGGMFSTPTQPPPLSSPHLQLFVALNGQQSGPFDLPVLQQMAQAGQLTRATLVWKQGMAAWATAGSVAELATLFDSTPPPLPTR